MKRTPLFWILLLSVVLRVGASIFLGDKVVVLPGTSDQVSYHNLALRVLGGYGFTFDKDWWPATRAGEPTAHWSYLYTLFLVVVYWIFGPHPIAARLIQAISIGLIHPYLVYKLGNRLFSHTAGLIAAFITAVYIYFIYYAATLMTEPFYITAILCSLLMLFKNSQPGRTQRIQVTDAVYLGLSFGAAILLRQLYLLIIPFALLWLVWACKKSFQHFPLRQITISLVIIFVLIMPFTIYNYNRFGRFVLLNTNAGFAFFWGNHPIYGSSFIPILTSDQYRELLPQDQLHLDEAALDQELLNRAIGFVTADPIRYFNLSISRISSYIEFWPSANSGLISNISRVASFGIFLPFMLWGLVLDIANRKQDFWIELASPSSFIILFGVVYAGIHILTWTLIRYRLPIDAVLILYAAIAIENFYTRWIKIRSKKPLLRKELQ